MMEQTNETNLSLKLKVECSDFEERKKAIEMCVHSGFWWSKEEEEKEKKNGAKRFSFYFSLQSAGW